MRRSRPRPDQTAVSKRPSVQVDEDHISPMQLWWSAWHWQLYCLLILASGSALGDAYLVPDQIESTIVRASQFEVNLSSKRSKMIQPWTVITMADGTKFQTPGSADLFPVGDTLRLERTPLWKQVNRYKKRPDQTTYWTDLANRNREYDLFPALVLLCSVMLLIPFRAEQARWLLHGILLFVCFGWLLTMIGTGGLTPWG